jgi:hypothetical protein
MFVINIRNNVWWCLANQRWCHRQRLGRQISVPKMTSKCLPKCINISQNTRLCYLQSQRCRCEWSIEIHVRAPLQLYYILDSVCKVAKFQLFFFHFFRRQSKRIIELQFDLHTWSIWFVCFKDVLLSALLNYTSSSIIDKVNVYSNSEQAYLWVGEFPSFMTTEIESLWYGLRGFDIWVILLHWWAGA